MTAARKKPAVDLKVEVVPIDTLTEDRANARKHGKRNLDAIKESLQQFGQRQPLVVTKELEVVAGNGRLVAAREMGWTEMAVVILPWDDPARCRAFALADNRTAELAEWDGAVLAATLEDLREEGWDMGALGFDGEVQVDEDDVPDLPDDKDVISEPGDLWILGRHRLLVGDATSPTDLERVMDGGKVDLAFTDPPYGVAYVGGTGLSIRNDDLSANELHELLRAAFVNIATVLRRGGAFYVCSPSGELETVFRLALDAAGLRLRQQLVWVKSSHVMGRQDYHGRHETILYGWADGDPFPLPGIEPPKIPEGDALYEWDHDTILYGWAEGAHTFTGGRRQNTVWEFDKPARSADHPTMKPVALVGRAILNGTNRGDVVLDPFGGSGSTLVAAHVTGRVARTIELDPRYADVIARRYQRLTGELPVLEATGQPRDFTLEVGDGPAR